MWNKRRQILKDLAAMEHHLHCQQALVVARKNKILTQFQHQYHICMLGMLMIAFLVGWKISKDFDVRQIVKTGWMIYLNNNL